MSERLQKFLARAGVASRRHAEGLITAGRVQVNNKRVTELGTKVEPSDLVTVDGSLVTAPEATSWYLLNKPPGVVTTLSDPEGRPTVAELLREVPMRVFPVGRLDWDAEGALLFTNDGAAAHRLLHPSFEVRRTYLVKVKGAPTEETLQRLCQGVRLEDGPARALRAERFESAERNTWLVLEVGEGRPHLVKRLCAAIGHPVLRLFRPAQGGISVAGMGAGEVRQLTSEEVARVQSVAAGTPVPEPTLFLPPRRHGRAGELEEAGGEHEAMAGSTPPAAPGAARRGGSRFGGAERHGRAARGQGDFEQPPGQGETRPRGRGAAIAGTRIGRQLGAPGDRQTFRGGSRASGAPARRPFGAPGDRPAFRGGSRASGAPARRPFGAPGDRPTFRGGSRASGAPARRPFGAPGDRQAFRGGSRASGALARRPFGAPGDRQAFRGGGRTGRARAGRPPGAPPRNGSAPAHEVGVSEGRHPQRFGRADRASGDGQRAARTFGAPRGRGHPPPSERGVDRGPDRGPGAHGPQGRAGGKDRRDVEHRFGRADRASGDGQRAARTFGAPRGRGHAPPRGRGVERGRWRGGAPHPEPSAGGDRGSGGGRRGTGSGHRLGASGARSDFSVGSGGFPRPSQRGQRRGGRFGALPSNRPYDRGHKPPRRPPPSGGRGGTRPGSGRRPPPRR
jgi:23S rRNA pseudouridine2605 synthase